MEYIEGGELFSYIGDMGSLPETHAIWIFRQILAALSYCHRLNIHHRDLKPENILLDRKQMQIKLVDFGMAALQPAGSMLTTPCGSPHYAAPEVIHAQSYDGAKADIWSCGVILYVMLTGAPPFNYSGHNRDLHYLYQDISQANYVMPPTLSSEAQNLIRKIFVPEPKDRISLEEIWEHPFMSKCNADLGITEETNSLNYWMGGDLHIPNWEKVDLDNLDREILRHLRTLWHSVTVDMLIERLTSRE